MKLTPDTERHLLDISVLDSYHGPKHVIDNASRNVTRLSIQLAPTPRLKLLTSAVRATV